MAHVSSGTVVTDTMATQWMWALFSSLGTALIMFALGLVRHGIQEIKSHLDSQDKELNRLNERVSKVEGKIGG